MILFFIILLVLASVKGQQPINLPTDGVQLYLPFKNVILSNFSMIYATQFYNIDQNNDPNNINDALWCQSPNNITNIGVWYYPNGTEVPLFDGDFRDASAPSPVFSKRFSGQIALGRRAGLAGYEGLYKCIIPDKGGVNQTLVVGAYTDAIYNANNGPDVDPAMQFSLLSTSRLAIPQVFSLSFNVSNSPPTTVSCTVNGSAVSTEVSHVIVNGIESITRVTVTNIMTGAGNYQCTVSNARVTAGTINGVTAVSNVSSLNISVFDTPTGFTVKRLSGSLTSVELSWSSVSGATGYDIYYSTNNGLPVHLLTTSTTSITSLNLTLEITYLFFIISYGAGPILPSPGNTNNTVTLNVPTINDLITDVTSTSITLRWSITLEPNDYYIEGTCHTLCDESWTIDSFFNSSLYQSAGLSPYTSCQFRLSGVYAEDVVNFTDNISVTTLSTVPSSSVGTVRLLSVDAVSMIVSWSEVNCSDRNGPITGYYLTYANITSNTSYTVNITGGYNTMCNLTGLIPYTNYTVIVAPHNNGVGPPSEALIQETDQSNPGVISDLISTNISTESISISWIPPTTPNGIITVYEIRYREFTSTGPYNITNTTNTQYSIVGLISNTSYTIGVRAYTSVGPGGWINAYFNTRAIRKLSVLSASFSSSLTLDNTCNTTSVSVSSELYISPLAIGLYAALTLLTVSIVVNIVLVINLCCRRSNTSKKKNTTHSTSQTPDGNNPDLDDYIPMGSTSLSSELQSLGPVYNRSIEPIYNRPIDDNSVEPLYNVIDGRRDIEPIYSVPSGRSHDSHMTGYCHDNVQVELDDVHERSSDSNITDEAVTYYVQMDSQEPAAKHDDTSHYYI